MSLQLRLLAARQRGVDPSHRLRLVRRIELEEQHVAFDVRGGARQAGARRLVDRVGVEDESVARVARCRRHGVVGVDVRVGEARRGHGVVRVVERAVRAEGDAQRVGGVCLLYTSPSPRDAHES
eukprot:182568-Prymnesium_polylepis.1